MIPLFIVLVSVVASAAPFVLVLRDELTQLERLGAEPFPATAAGPWWTWALGFGFVLPLAVLGTFVLGRGMFRDPVLRLVLLWICVQFTLVYSSVTFFQRRYIEGLVVPLCGLAAVGLGWTRLRGSARSVHAAVGSLLILGSLTVANILGQNGQYVEDHYSQLWPSITAADVVLAGNYVSSILPAFSPGTVYLGRPVETLRSQSKAMERSKYEEDATSEWSQAWLRRSGITLVVVDRADASFSPRRMGELDTACMEPLLDGPRLDLYRVQAGCRGLTRARS